MEKVNAAMLRVFSCKLEVVAVSFEEVSPAYRKENVNDVLVSSAVNHLMIFKGKKSADRGRARSDNMEHEVNAMEQNENMKGLRDTELRALLDADIDPDIRN